MLFFITALMAEAKPLIHHFALKKIFNDTPFPIFRKDNIYLIVSGIGKENVYTALGYLSGLVQKYGVFFNIGIAGHSSWKIGTCALVSKILDATTQETFYPTFLDKYPIIYAPLITVSQPEERFQKEALYDMEGSSFFKAALHFTTSEFIHSLKVVSDNLTTPFQKESVYSLIENHLPLIEKIAFSLLTFVKKKAPSIELSPLLECSHFTETQRHQLKQILHQLQLYSGEEILNFLKQNVSSSLY